MIEVEDGGLLTTVQDGGRYGMYDIGMPPSGAMDDFSFRVANLLVGNEEDAAALEVTYFGPRLHFDEDRIVAVTGADMPPMVDGDSRPTWEAFEVKADETLHFDYLRGGARAYIAVAGAIEVEEVLGSRSTYTLCAIGGYDGRGVREGDRISLGERRAGADRAGAQVGEARRPKFSKETELRTMIGLCSYRLTEESIETFLEAEWTVTPDADRVGYRYRGAELEFAERERAPFGAGSDPANVVDLGYPVGSIQVPGGVEPIILLNDAVTGGGYATIGTVISVDRDRLAQTKTHDKTRFRSVGMDEALAARAERRRRLDEIRTDLGA